VRRSNRRDGSLTEQLSVQSGIEHRVKHVLIEKTGISGAKKIRPELKKLEILIRGEKIKFLIFEELSRLSRILKHLLEFLDLCKQYGVAVYIRGLPNVNINSAAGEMFIHTMGSAAQFERSLTIERVKNTLRAAALRDSKINGGSIVYGFSRDQEKKGNWIPVIEEIKNIEFMMKSFLEVGSITETIKISNKYGIKNKNGRSFDCTSLKKLFENRKLIGELHVVHGNNDELKSVVPLPFGAVIDVGLFEKVQIQIAQNDGARANLNRRGTKIYLLTGILHDQNGATYAGQSAICRNGKRKNYYYEAKTKSRIDADQLEEKILRSLSGSIENNVELDKHSHSISQARSRKIEVITAEINRLKSEVIDVEKKELEIIKGLSFLGLGASEDTMKWLNNQVRVVEQSRRSTGERLEELSREKEQLLKTEINLKKYQNRAIEIFRRMKKAAPIKQRQFLRQVIEKIELNPSGEVRIDWKFSEVFTAKEEVVAPTKKWLGRRDSNPRPTG
jgi:DNA invertase Pin-like site-specific DNA recombinase